MGLEDTSRRKSYIERYNEMAAETLYEEKLPMLSEVIEFATSDGEKKSARLQHVFDFFGDEEELKDLVSRTRRVFDGQQSSDFIASVIAANITDISESGTIYKMLQATGDSFRIRGKDCHSSGRHMDLPLTEEEFRYSVRNSNVILDPEKPEEYTVFHDYEEFCKATEGLTEIHVRNPETCGLGTKHGCCPVCAGELPDGVQNLGAFATLMITEVATQNALSSMNKGRKENVNKLLTAKSNDIKSLEQFYKWADDILERLTGDKVERRFYEIALLGRLHVDGDKVRVATLMNPASDNLFGEFIYRPREVSFRKLVNSGSFNDDSLKTQIAFNSYNKGIL